MTLFVSDMHLGRGTPDEERAEERDLIAFLGRYAGRARRLCLVGDVFDHFIEYHRLVCKGFVRFQATLAKWADRGKEVIYVVGNHDPWHRDYFAAELGIRLVKDSLLQDLDGTATYFHHGSGLTPRGRMVQNVLRHPLPVWGYRTLLPASAGVGLASWVSRLRRHGVPDAQSVAAAREHARHIWGRQTRALRSLDTRTRQSSASLKEAYISIAGPGAAIALLVRSQTTRFSFSGGTAGKPSSSKSASCPPPQMPKTRKRSRGDRYRRFLTWLLRHPRKVQAAHALTVLFLLGCLAALVLAGYMLLLSRDMPSLSQIENPSFEFASVAYTADGVELARFGRQNRSWIAYDDISPHVKNALISTEDHRFESHWGMDMFRTFSALVQSALGKLGLPFERQGGSTITQQLARNLYNDQIGFAVTVERKLKEMATAVQLERRYSKQEIVEMYLNTVPFRHNAFGIEAAGRTYFGKSAQELEVLEAAALIGMLKGTYLYDPVRNPDRSRERRNVVLRQMVRHGHLDRQVYETYRDSLTTTRFRSADVTQSFAPYFAEYIRNWVSAWGRENGIDVYGEGLRIHTTLDSGLQRLAQEAVQEQMDGLQAAVDCEWSAQSSPRFVYGEDLEAYEENPCHTVETNRWAYFWENRQAQLDVFIRETPRFAALVRDGASQGAALAELRGDAAFMDSLKSSKTRLEVGLVSTDPRTGHIRAWVGGRNLAEDWFDHVAIAKRQAGSTFKPFVYTAAIDAGYFPTYALKDTLINYVDPYTNEVWSPLNSGKLPSGEIMTLREGLARSLNTISGQLILEIKPSTAALYAKRMGIESPLDPVPALALGTSDVSLLELVTGYSTLANLGIRNKPVAILRIEDRRGTVLYEHRPAPGEALSDITSAVMIDMLRGVINESYGTGNRIRRQFELTDYDFAGKTGTTQEGADGWFVLMHPELVTGAWVGFNDRRISFRSAFWGQGAHNALFVVGDYVRRAALASEEFLGKGERFPVPEAFGFVSPAERDRAAEGYGRVKW